jgi:hypothetical protein
MRIINEKDCRFQSSGSSEHFLVAVYRIYEFHQRNLFIERSDKVRGNIVLKTQTKIFCSYGHTGRMGEYTLPK